MNKVILTITYNLPILTWNVKVYLICFNKTVNNKLSNLSLENKYKINLKNINNSYVNNSINIKLFLFYKYMYIYMKSENIFEFI